MGSSAEHPGHTCTSRTCWACRTHPQLAGPETRETIFGNTSSSSPRAHFPTSSSLGFVLEPKPRKTLHCKRSPLANPPDLTNLTPLRRRRAWPVDCSMGTSLRRCRSTGSSGASSSVQKDYATHPQDWESRHHLAAVENERKPKGIRDYFSRQQSLPELRDELARRKCSHSMLKRLAQEEELPPETKSLPNGADVRPSSLPGRHAIDGIMLDRDGEVRQWNDRWHLSMSTDLNELSHPLHREYFDKKAPTQGSPSLQWRRQDDHQVEIGQWRANTTEKAPLFPPVWT